MRLLFDDDVVEIIDRGIHLALEAAPNTLCHLLDGVVIWLRRCRPRWAFRGRGLSHARIWSLLVFAVVVTEISVAVAEAPKSEPYAATVLQDEPVAYWRFEDDRFETRPKSLGHRAITRVLPSRLHQEDALNDASAESKGFRRADQVEPRPERFMVFEAGDQVAVFELPAVIKSSDLV